MIEVNRLHLVPLQSTQPFLAALLYLRLMQEGIAPFTIDRTGILSGLDRSQTAGMQREDGPGSFCCPL